MLLRLRAAPLLALLYAGCSSPAPAPCAYAGDASAPIEAELFGYAPDQTFTTIADGGALLITGAPQGGYVLYAGALLQNVSECKVTLAAELLDPGSGAALTNRDQRQGNFGEALDGSVGWAAPDDDYADLPNIPACPDALGRGIVGVPSILQVTVTDELGKSGTFTQAVTAVCATGDSSCRCQCGPSDGGGCP